MRGRGGLTVMESQDEGRVGAPLTPVPCTVTSRALNKCVCSFLSLPSLECERHKVGDISILLLFAQGLEQCLVHKSTKNFLKNSWVTGQLRKRENKV